MIIDLKNFSEDLVYLLNTLNDGIMVIDKNATVVFVNEAYCKLTGIAFSDIVGKHLWDVRPGGALPKVLDTKVKILNAYHFIKGVKTYSDLIPLFDENNSVIGGIAVIKDSNEIEQLSELLQSKKQIHYLRNTLLAVYKAHYTFDNIMCFGMDHAVRQAKKAACSDITVFLSGETGVGKGVLAEAIHNESDRKDKAFVAINMTAFPSELLESELFGYEEGAFTGAKKTGKLGLISVAEGGTIFLDEIGDMPLNLQIKLLKVIDEKKVRRLGSTTENAVNIRFISASNQNLTDKVKNRTFREDLYYRLAVFSINIPSLYERKKHIPEYINSYIEYWEKKLKHSIQVDASAYAILCGYYYPGNVRELRNCIEYAVNVMSNYKITAEELPNYLIKTDKPKSDCSDKTLEMIVRETENEVIGQYIAMYGCSLESKKKIAKLLNISLATLYSKIQKCNRS